LLDLEIRDDAPSDHARVYEVERSAFGSALQADLVNALRDSAEPKLSLVALLEDEIVGHIFFSPVTLASKPAPPAAQLSPVAVAPSHRRRGIGSRLIRAGLERCPSRGWSSVFLVGNPHYYSRFGFEMAKPRSFSCEGAHAPFLQLLELRPGALADLSGLIRFHPAFSEL
jgi:putative acetyltransferase